MKDNCFGKSIYIYIFLWTSVTRYVPHHHFLCVSSFGRNKNNKIKNGTIIIYHHWHSIFLLFFFPGHRYTYTHTPDIKYMYRNILSPFEPAFLRILHDFSCTLCRDTELSPIKAFPVISMIKRSICLPATHLPFLFFYFSTPANHLFR